MLDNLPKTNRVIVSNKIPIISARDFYENTNIPVEMWKVNIFKKVVSSNDKNVIIIGDSDYEKLGIISLYKDNPNRYLKLIKFISIPTYSSIKTQIDIMINLFRKNTIIDIRKNLDLQFTVK
jgi:hypothetical protein